MSDDLRIEDLVPASGGKWGGLLFENPKVGLPPQLTWNFTFPFEDLDDMPVALTIEWVPLPDAAWHAMAGRAARSTAFAETAEASLYHYQHHRFASVDLQVAEQDGTAVRVRATVAGDIDRLGLEAVTADAWLDFTGIIVSLTGVASAEEAAGRLRRFTDPAGLTAHPGVVTGTYRFTA